MSESMTTALRALERTKVKPILFSGPMVRALIEGRKTQTRRVLKPQPPDCHRLVGIYGPGLTAVFEPLSRDDYTVRLPYIDGQLLWVRETWVASGTGVWTIADARRQIATDQKLHFAADGGDGPWWPSIHMPREFSRLTLEVTAVTVERLQDISEEDALAEGVTRVRDHCYVIRGVDYDLAHLCHSSPVTPFAKLWDSLNARRGYGWDANPWVAAVSFRVHKMNVDTILAQREAA